MLDAICLQSLKRVSEWIVPLLATIIITAAAAAIK